MGQKVCPWPICPSAVFCACAGRKLGAGLSGGHHHIYLHLVLFSLSCVEPGNDMSLSDILSALTMIILHCYSLGVLIVSLSDRKSSFRWRGSCRKNGRTERSVPLGVSILNKTGIGVKALIRNSVI